MPFVLMASVRTPCKTVAILFGIQQTGLYTKRGDRMTTQQQTQAPETTSPSEVRAAWVQAMRLRTLPLAASGSFIAAGIAAHFGAFRAEVFALMFIVSMLLQVIANFADDYGDLSHGLDDETRVGPRRGMQRGIITPAQMKNALTGICSITFVLGCVLIGVSFTGGPTLTGSTWSAVAFFVALGMASIAAAVLYTVGPHPYGYLGLGDIVSAVFFGLVAVVAGSFLYLHVFEPVTLLAGVALGLPVAAVMNINNMRDSTADAAKGKHTIANRLYAAGIKSAETADVNVRATTPITRDQAGERRMRMYHRALVYVSMALFLLVVLLTGANLPLPLSMVRAVLVLVCFIPLARATSGVCHQLDHTKLDRFMAPTSMGTVLVSLGATVALLLGPIG